MDVGRPCAVGGVVEHHLAKVFPKLGVNSRRELPGAPQERDDIDITLVNPRPAFVERIRLHQLVAGSHAATVDYGPLLGDGIDLVVDRATRIDTANRTVDLANGPALAYDDVIYAVGSTATAPASVPGAAEHAHPLAELEHAQRLRAAIGALRPGAPVTVVGAGLTGIEAASELA